jgi:stage II sporulation SpoE-like protein
MAQVLSSAGRFCKTGGADDSNLGTIPDLGRESRLSDTRHLLPSSACGLSLIPAGILQFEYVGDCVQAFMVGGDYYDFLDLGPGQVGFVLADVAGKGIAAALLMANLQGNLHSQCGIASKDPVRMLDSVNRHFYNHSETHR